MRQGIETRYLGPTNRRGSRIKAVARKADNWGAEQSATLPRDCGLSTEANHCRAAKACADGLGWPGLWISSGNAAGNGYNFTCAGAINVGLLTSDDLACLGVEGADWFLV